MKEAMQALGALFLAVFAAGAAWAGDETPGDFDYYVLSLSWSPNWCAQVGDAHGSEQCDKDRDFGWTLHGLWPQYDNGWPDYCKTTEHPPSQAMTLGMADIMGTAGLAWHQWEKHGTCSGLSAGDYFALSRQAYEAVNRPAMLRQLDKPVTLPASVVEEAFLEANPGWNADMLTITCKESAIAEARLCLTRDLDPRPCTGRTLRDCTATDALLTPIR
ncbi:ribonuclease T2 [Chachezhania antarctica]|uniref:ribonuclease T2 n=1 Tax=Chachezhania antarctica TaxID=2340860 RepID=UPI001F099E36|nr:ribonuclease T2 [Chachezhania antarctica]|tara:strand:+ start:907 stop:1557 length:651 start_codon:yes stop_codon:yes gene_type:complete